MLYMKCGCELYIEFNGCNLGEDTSLWSITWPPTDSNKPAMQKCPGMSESMGKAIMVY